MMLAGPEAEMDRPLVVALSRDAHHAGLLYRPEDAGEEPVFFFHHIGEDDLRHHFADLARLRWAMPALSIAQLKDVRNVAVLLHDTYVEEGRALPYGFDNDLAFDRDGELVAVDAEAGLTCSTFVAAVFARAGYPLVDLATWTDASAARRQEDEARQRRSIDQIRAMSPVRAATLEKRVRAPHLRVEEVAAASTLSPRPVDFATAEPAGLALLAELAPAAGA